MENFQNSRQNSQEWMFQQVHPKVRLWNADRRDCKLRLRLHGLNVKVHDSTIRKRLNWLLWEKKTSSLSKEHGSSVYVCKFVSEQTATVVLSVSSEQDETSVKTFGYNAQKHVCRNQRGTNISYQMSSTVVEGWWFELVLQPHYLGTLQSVSRPWTSLYPKVFSSQM